MSAGDPIQEFLGVLSAAAGAHAFALNGIRKEREFWASAERIGGSHGTTADSTVWIGDGAPQDPRAITYSAWRLGDLPAVLAEGGPVAVQISQQWAVSVFTDWEEEYRQRISDAIGAAEPIRLDAFGDLRLFRNDIVHHRGTATERNTGRCELFHWFAPGEVLYFDGAKVAEFMAAIGAVWTR